MNLFEDNILNIYHEKGAIWLKELPRLVKQYESKWDLSELSPFRNLSYNYVLSGYQNDLPIVLKLGLDKFNLEQEAKALGSFQGYRAVSLIDYDSAALLLQRALPGKTLKERSQKNKKNIQIACEIIEKLHKAPVPKDQSFPHIQDWLMTLDREWAIPKNHLLKARVLKKQLLHTSVPQILLHGDLHLDNILSHRDEWLIIDPKGVIGFPINEIWTCVEDPEHDLEYISHYFKFDFDDVVKWYYVHLILAACWQVEDNQDPQRFLNLAEQILPWIKA